ncbi:MULTISPECIES: phosphotransferase family protein [unclassified Novosphingobium]|uniref:phosphotransferase family protein n=1 Tax=unclassified Novosphingobium TaxID=2644732 RepID=UPI001357BDAF|nr:MULTISPECIES: phosphotransferase family protein [unclassified Novosphingobium]
MTETLRLPAFDEATLRGHLLGVAETISAALNAGACPPGSDGDRRLRECATVTARIAQALGPRAPREDVSAACELAALRASETAFAAQRERRAEVGIAPPTAGARQLDPAALETYLRAHPLGGPDFALVHSRILSGGRCKLTALVEHGGAGPLPPAMILRQDWDGGATDTTVTDEFELLALLHSEGLLVPRPFLLEPAESAVGLPFMLMERMGGTLDAGLFEPPSGPGLARQLAHQIGRLHAIPLERLHALGLRQEPACEDDLRAVVAAFAQGHREIGIASAIVDAALEWLDANLALFGPDRCLIHNDLGFHNCLTEGDRLTAVLDWELAQIGHPAADLGYVKHFVVRMMPWDQFLAAYRDAGGWSGSAATLRFHTIWNAIRLYGLIMRARAAIAGGHVRDIEISHACADNLLLLLIFLGEELEAAQAPT